MIRGWTLALTFFYQDLFDLIVEKGFLDEATTRHLFVQVIQDLKQNFIELCPIFPDGSDCDPSPQAWCAAQVFPSL